MKLNKKEIANNLRLFGYKRYSSMKKFADALDMNPSTLYSGYLNGRSIPGPVLLVKLMKLGCDMHWLLTGENLPLPGEDVREHIKKLEEENHFLRTQVTRTQTTGQRILEKKRGVVVTRL